MIIKYIKEHKILTALITSLICIITLSCWFVLRLLTGISNPIDAIPHVYKLVQQILSNPPLPSLYIHIKHKDYQNIAHLRKQALDSGSEIISPREKIWFPAKIQGDDGIVHKARIRLKGDWTDHIEDPKRWSFRIKIKDKGSFHGFRTFSIQRPQTRYYHTELFVHEFMRMHDVLAPRTTFTHVYINGDSIGLMYLEEFFRKELLESQQRKESVIIKHNEQAFWDAKLYARKSYNVDFDSIDSTNTHRIGIINYIDRFGNAKDTSLIQSYTNAVSLLRGLRENLLAVEDVIDIEQAAKFCAIHNIIGCTEHGVTTNHNHRYYYNPITAKLEYISYDNMMPPQQKNCRLNIKASDSPVIKKLADNKAFQKLYTANIKKIAQDIISSKKYNELFDRMDYYYRFIMLYYEYKYLPSIKLRLTNHARERLVKKKQTISTKERENVLINTNNILRVYAIEKDTKQYFEFDRWPAAKEAREPITIHKIYTQGKGTTKKELRLAQEFPIKMQKNRLFLEYSQNQIPQNHTITVEYSVGKRKTKQHATVIQHYSLARTKPLIPQSSIQEQQKIHPFLKLTGQKILIPSGKHIIHKDIIISAKQTLEIQENSTLLFHEGSGIISHGNIVLRGSKEKPIILDGYRGKSWKGIAVLNAKKQSIFEHVDIRNTSGMRRSTWNLTGSITFYQSNIVMNNVSIRKNRSEDALNIVRSSFRIKGIQVSDTSSDAIDFDFARGELSGGHFANIAGDALDFSGTQGEITNSKFTHIRDKALSIGEESSIKSQNIYIKNSSIGFAIKDGSQLRLEDANLERVKSGFLSYNKKAVYGESTTQAQKIRFHNVDTPAKASHDNKLNINLRDIPPQRINIQKLYNK